MVSGLKNLGNTCFMNSALQCLSHTYELTDLVSKKDVQVKNIDLFVLKEWKDLNALMHSKNCIISPNRFLHSIHESAKQKKNILFTGYAQNDVSEFIMFLFDCFHEATKRDVEMNIKGTNDNNTDEIASLCYTYFKKHFSNQYSDIVSLFYGIHVSHITDTNRVCIQKTPETFFMLHLPIPNKTGTTLMECFQLYTTPNILDGNNQYLHDGKKIDAHQQILFFSLPQILIIDIKRFTNQNKKNETLVSFPHTLDLSSFIVGYKPESFVYELFGICNHMGSVRGGHYTACAKVKDGTWYHFNDMVVQKIENINTLQTNKAYCFFYRKIKK